MFVDSKARTPVKDPDGNTVWIKSRMTLADEAQLVAFIRQYGAFQWSHELATLKTNVVAWEGPAFVYQGKPVQCIPANIDRLDRHAPEWATLWRAVLEAIDTANKPPVEPPAATLPDPLAPNG